MAGTPLGFLGEGLRVVGIATSIREEFGLEPRVFPSTWVRHDGKHVNPYGSFRAPRCMATGCGGWGRFASSEWRCIRCGGPMDVK
jgi:hypothetical protein